MANCQLESSILSLAETKPTPSDPWEKRQDMRRTMTDEQLAESFDDAGCPIPWDERSIRSVRGAHGPL